MSEPLKFHPAADRIPPMTEGEYKDLKADIQANGLREPIIIYQGMVLDGRHRLRACTELGIEPFKQSHHDGCAAIGDPVAYVISRNLHRRHLDAEQKRKLLVDLVKVSPEKADRVLAREAKVDHKQISRARRKAEATGAIAPVEKRVGADGKARKQPAKPGNGLNAVGKPYSPQYDPAYKMRKQALKAPDRGRGDVAEDMLDVLSGLNKERRADFFRALWDKFRDELIKAQTDSYEMAVKPKPPSADTTSVANMDALVENAPPPDVSAEARKAQMAALDVSKPATA